MPVDQSSTFQPVRALTLAVLGIAVAVGFMFFAVNLTGSDGGIEFKLGDDVFEAGKPELMARLIEEDGPIPYPDPVDKGRDIFLQHLGDDPEDGWLAFDARRPGQPRECPLDWVATPDEGPVGYFVDRCDDSVTITADGGDLPQYPVIVEDDMLIVDINAALGDE